MSSKVITLELADAEATTQLGARLAPLLAPGDLVLLYGDLGAGKSTLARGLIVGLTGVTDAPSPTYTLVETYEVEDGADGFELWHFDLYRLERPDDVWELGLEEALDGAAAVIEWPERIATLLAPLSLPEALIVRFRVGGDGGGRIVDIELSEELGEGGVAGQNWRRRLEKAGIA